MFNQKGFSFLYIIVGIGALFILAAGIRYFPEGYLTKTETIQTVEEYSAKDLGFLTPYTVLQNIYKEGFFLKNNQNDVIVREDSLWWESDDNYSVIVPNGKGVVFTAEFPDDGFIEHQDDLVSGYILNNSSLKQFYSLAIKNLTQDGFVKDSKNSHKDFDSEVGLFGYVEGYKKGNTVCTVTLPINPYRPYGDNGSVYFSVDVLCSDSFNEAYAEQKPVLAALKVRDAVITIDKASGEYYKYQVNYRITGHYAVVKKSGDKVEVIIEGSQDSQQLCDLIKEGKVPSDLQDCTPYVKE